MKKWILAIALALVVMTTTATYAQHSGAKHAVTIKYVGVDYRTPLLDDQTPGYEGLFDPANVNNTLSQMTYGVEVGYFHAINDYLSVGAPLRFGILDSAGLKSLIPDVQQTNSLRGFVSLDAMLKLQYYNKKSPVVPYITAGLGSLMVFGQNMDLQAPVGMGLNFRLSKSLFFQVQTEYRYSFDSQREGRPADSPVFRDNMNHSAGLFFTLGEQEEEEEVIGVTPTDTDGDGIVDEKDECPAVAGLAAFNGCPDSDGDGVADAKDGCPETAGLMAFNGCPDTDGDGIKDADDACPTEAGTKENKGCPTVDSDGDGVADKDDACPTEAGLSRFSGCPDTDGDGVADKDDACPDKAGSPRLSGCPDTDGDGVADKDDKCPATPGVAALKGCPEIKQEDKEALEFAAKNVEFVTGKAQLTTESQTVLMQVVEIMQRYGDYSLRISGHTDNVGAEASNQQLSEARAKACFDYLASKGIAPSRMSYVGYGESKPVADNNTKEGRQRNRRTELEIYLK